VSTTTLNKAFRILLWSAGVVLLLLAGISGWIYLNQDKLKARMIEEINQHLEAEIHVQQVDLAFWQTFPLVSLQFKSLVVPGHGPAADGESLLEAESVFIQFNLWQMIKGDYQLQRIEIQNARAEVIFIPGRGGNYDLFKSSPDTLEEKSKAVNLDRIILFQTYITYKDPERIGSAYFQQGKVSMKINGDSLQLSLRANGDLLSWKEGETALPDSLPFELSGKLSHIHQTTRLTNVRLSSRKLALRISGAFSPESQTLQIQGERLDLKELIALLPVQYRSFEKEVDSKGQLNLQANYSNGAWDASFSLTDAWLKHKQNNLELKDVQLSGKYLHQKNDRLLELHTLSAKSSTGTLNAQASFRFQPEWWLNVQLKADGNMEEWLSFWPDTSWGKAEGAFLADLRYEGFPNRPNAMKEARGQGQLILKNISLSIAQFPFPIANLNGTLNFQEGQFHTSVLRFLTGNTNWSVQAELPNFWEVLVGNQNTLSILGAVSADKLILDDWIKAFETPQQNAEKSTFELPDKWWVSAGIEVQQLNYKSFSASNVKADFLLNNSQLSLRNAVMNSCGGALGGDFWLKETNTGFHMATQVKLTALELPAIFMNFRNFGQDKLQGQHLQGILNGSANLQLPLSASLEPNLAELVAEVPFTVSKGRLRGFEPLQALSKFIRVEELADIAFEQLTNTVFIKQSQIHIPEMEVRSSALNLVLSGNHSFDNTVNYRFNLLLRDLLAGRFKRSRGDAFGEYTEEQGGTRLFLKMTGPADNPQTAYDLASVGNKIREDIRNEGREIQNLLRQDFGTFRKDSTHRPPRPGQRERKRLREQEGFDVE